MRFIILEHATARDGNIDKTPVQKTKIEDIARRTCDNRRDPGQTGESKK